MNRIYLGISSPIVKRPAVHIRKPARETVPGCEMLRGQMAASPPLVGADPQDVFERQHEDLAVPILPVLAPLAMASTICRLLGGHGELDFTLAGNPRCNSLPR